MNGTFTATRTSTFTDARLRSVMPEVGADFYAVAVHKSSPRHRPTLDRGTNLHPAARSRARLPNSIDLPYGQRIAIDYRVSSDGSIQKAAQPAVSITTHFRQGPTPRFS